jgi:hypothetical protein
MSLQTRCTFIWLKREDSDVSELPRHSINLNVKYCEGIFDREAQLAQSRLMTSSAIYRSDFEMYDAVRGPSMGADQSLNIIMDNETSKLERAILRRDISQGSFKCIIMRKRFLALMASVTVAAIPALPK